MLSKADILKAKPTWSVVEVDAPELGGTVGIRGLTINERDTYGDANRSRMKDGRLIEAKGLRLLLLTLCLCDDKGTRLFDEKDVAHLGHLSPEVVDRLYEQAMKICFPADVDELEKNSEATTKDDSVSS